MTIEGIWAYPPRAGRTGDMDLTGFTVVAGDGTIGHVDREADTFGMRHLVVDTGVWVFGRSVLVPAGVVRRIDPAGRRIEVSCSRAEIKAAPRFRTDSETGDRGYLTRVGEYYHGLPPRQEADTA
ncbi:PRC-barrel domain containing protein [Streptomyces sp. NPDC006743]|uniref:PRC-barrel domain containing protein n=1 Tax=Streptomyces sp. NPDC006743 TaxID=3154480 RepID=UPI0034565F43